MKRLLAGAIALLVSGCFATRLPRITDAERRAMSEAPIDVTVVVVNRPRGVQALHPAIAADYQRFASGYARGLASSLRGVVRSVAFDSAGLGDVSADLVVESMQLNCNPVIVPILTIFTLGLVPTVYKDSTCTGMVFRRYGAPRDADSVVVKSAFVTREAMGWGAAFLLLWPSWDVNTPSQPERRTAVFRAGVFAKRQELEQLARR